MTTRNTYRVPVKQWRKWKEAARAAFNSVYSTIHDNQRLITHPDMPKIKPAHWKTVAWNAAWLAADAAQDAAKLFLQRGDIVKDINKRGQVVREHRVH